MIHLLAVTHTICLIKSAENWVTFSVDDASAYLGQRPDINGATAAVDLIRNTINTGQIKA